MKLYASEVIPYWFSTSLSILTTPWKVLVHNKRKISEYEWEYFLIFTKYKLPFWCVMIQEAPEKGPLQPLKILQHESNVL